MSEFDSFAESYDAALHSGLSLSGEAKDYFAEGRVQWMQRKLADFTELTPRHVLDFGCGTGTSCPLLKNLPGVSRVVGVDPSSDSLQVAAEQRGEDGIAYVLPEELPEQESFDVVFCNGVFHHIPVEERMEALAWIDLRLAPSGLFFFWENNPLNLGTQLVMRRIPFDRDAIKILPWVAKRLLNNAGFVVLDISFLFVFPSSLKRLRVFERALSPLPLGGQYLVIAKKL